MERAALKGGGLKDELAPRHAIAARYRRISQQAFPIRRSYQANYAHISMLLAGAGTSNWRTRAMNIPMTQSSLRSAPSLKGKVSLVTGSTSGIGLGIARALAAAGSSVVLNGFGNADEIAELQGKLAAEFGVKVAFSGADMSKPDAIAGMIAMTLEKFGRLDVLVNNAGIQYVAPLQEFPVAKWDAILAINLSSAFHTTRLALPAMVENKWGRIINIASAHGLVASPFKSAYVAAKHGIIGLTKVTALETAEQGITCNAICPGYVYTPLVEAQIEGQAKAHNIPREQVIRDVLLAQQPNKRFASVEELGALSVFLASEAAASITGVALPVDGGWTAH
jgi:3-hydroxybutyrate dehydrogenase